jgi:hypothetical protein
MPANIDFVPVTIDFVLDTFEVVFVVDTVPVLAVVVFLPSCYCSCYSCSSRR